MFIIELYGTPAMMDECDEDDNLSGMYKIV